MSAKVHFVVALRLGEARVVRRYRGLSRALHVAEFLREEGERTAVISCDRDNATELCEGLLEVLNEWRKICGGRLWFGGELWPGSPAEFEAALARPVV